MAQINIKVGPNSKINIGSSESLQYEHTEKEYREGFYFLERSLTKMLEMVVDMTDPRNSKAHVLIISCRNRALMIYAPDNYIKVIDVVPTEDHMQLNLLAYHDSEWRSGIQIFVRKLLAEKLSNPEIPDFEYVPNVGRWEHVADLAQATGNALRIMNYNQFHSSEDRMHKTVPFDQKVFHLVSNSCRQ